MQPIHTPGAVQGFGVLIALEEDTETGNLLVRQVSEVSSNTLLNISTHSFSYCCLSLHLKQNHPLHSQNSTKLLGLTPQYLFSLDCFTHTLPESQADVLSDNIQYLTDPDEDPASLNEDGPQVFLLSGYGQPGRSIFDFDSAEGSETEGLDGDSPFRTRRGSGTLALGDLSTGITQNRRHWTCWCAAHRPKATRPRDDLIILELELEPDIYHPSCPPPDESPAVPADVHIPPAPSSSDGVSTGGRSLGEDYMSSERATKPHQPSLSVGDIEVPRLSREPSDVSSTPTTIVHLEEKFHLPPKHPGLKGDEDWMPSPEAILASTTNKAKPLKALERMRRIERASHQRSLQQAERAGGHKFKGGQNWSPGGASIPHVFAVLAQVNEQLSAAPDLRTFLDIVTGIMKDLTQFHRVLVYQFDENDNGQASFLSFWGFSGIDGILTFWWRSERPRLFPSWWIGARPMIFIRVFISRHLISLLKPGGCT